MGTMNEDSVLLALNQDLLNENVFIRSEREMHEKFIEK